MTPEEFRQNLRVTGQFKEFKERRQALQDEGYTAKESWEMAALEFGWEKPEPKKKPDKAEEKNEGEAPGEYNGVSKEMFSDEGCGTIESVEWVAQTLALDNITPEEAPSSSAWGLREWARKNHDEFWKNIWSKTLPSRLNMMEQERTRDKGKMQFDLIEKLLKEFELADNHPCEENRNRTWDPVRKYLGDDPEFVPFLLDRLVELFAIWPESFSQISEEWQRVFAEKAKRLPREFLDQHKYLIKRT